jgi:hypothetical protein
MTVAVPVSDASRPVSPFFGRYDMTTIELKAEKAKRISMFLPGSPGTLIHQVPQLLSQALENAAFRYPHGTGSHR